MSVPLTSLWLQIDESLRALPAWQGRAEPLPSPASSTFVSAVEALPLAETRFGPTPTALGWAPDSSPHPITHVPPHLHNCRRANGAAIPHRIAPPAHADTLAQTLSPPTQSTFTRWNHQSSCNSVDALGSHDRSHTFSKAHLHPGRPALSASRTRTQGPALTLRAVRQAPGASLLID